MRLAPGVHIGRYEVLEAIGAGGMGQVWKARDARLGREVAIKALPPEFSNDADRLARLRREAKLLAALNHPNIATIYELEEAEGTQFLVLELVDGMTLDERIQEGAVPMDEALEFARQIADALEAAHDRGIVHRDLKPANIKITTKGAVKVLDFGLAKPVGVVAGSDSDSPTLTQGTAQGKLLGTPAYMSPEQVRAEEADARTDIWAFGVILVEMLTGKPLFESRTSADTMARIISSTSVDAELPATTPPLVTRLIHRCLAQNVDERFRHIADARHDLDDAFDEQYSALTENVLSGRRAWLQFVAASGALTIGAVGGWIGAAWNKRPRRPFHSYIISGPNIIGLIPGNGLLAISDDGRYIAFTTAQNLVVYSTETQDRMPLPLGVEPFFSPDGERIAFVTTDWTLVHSPVDSVNPTQVAAITTRALGGSWGDDGLIYFATSAGLFSVSEDGGVPPKPLIAPDPANGELVFGWPEILPGSRAIVFTIMPVDDAFDPQLAVLDLETMGYERLRVAGSRAVYMEAGYLLAADRGELATIPFDLRRLRMDTDRELVTHGFAVDESAPSFDVSSNGTLIHMPEQAIPDTTMTWFDRTGDRSPTGMTRGFRFPRLSPDGEHLVGDVWFDQSLSRSNLFVYSFERDKLSQLTFGPGLDVVGVWHPNSERFYFSSDRDGSLAIYSVDVNSPQSVELIHAEADKTYFVTTILPDGSRLVAREIVAGQPDKFVTISLTEPRILEVLFNVPSKAHNAKVSPIAPWVAYQSDETGAWEVYLRSLEDGHVQPVSGSTGGVMPLWSRDGSKVYYLNGESTIVEVTVNYEPVLELSREDFLYQLNIPIDRNGPAHFDISDDGRFLIRTVPSGAGPLQRLNRFYVVQNAFSTLGR